MISIIVSVYNQLAMNKIFYEELIKNTKNDFELIIIDNNSNDGSREFFENQKNTIVIKNDGNYNYPSCQNQGIRVAKYDTLCFFNNDLIPSKNWDERMFQVFESDKRIKVLSFATNDHLETKAVQKKLNRKWKRILNPILFLFGNNTRTLKLMFKLMYKDFDAFTENRFQQWKLQTIEGYSGSIMIIKKEAIDTIGMWDERLQSADSDLFNRVKKCSLENNSILPIQLALGIYFHHYQRLTCKSPYPPFVNKDIIIKLQEKWGDETKELRKDIVG